MEEKKVIEILRDISSASDIDDIENDNVKTWLDVMPGAFLRYIFDIWKEISSERTAGYVSKELKEYGVSLTENVTRVKMRGFRGVEEREASALLEMMLCNWREKGHELDVPDIKDVCNNVIEKLFSTLGGEHHSLLLKEFKGKGSAKFFQSAHERYGAVIIHGMPLRHDKGPQDQYSFSRFYTAMLPYIELDKKKQRGIMGWVVDIVMQDPAEPTFNKKMSNFGTLQTSLKSLMYRENKPHASFFIEAYNAEKSTDVKRALNERLVVAVRHDMRSIFGVEQETYAEADGKEPTDPAYFHLLEYVKKTTSDNWVYPHASRVWGRQAVSSFIPQQGAHAIEDVAMPIATTVQPDSTGEIAAKHFVIAAPIANTTVGRGKGQQTLDLKFATVEMASLGEDQELNMLLMYSAMMHRIGRKPMIDQKIKTIDPRWAVWALRRIGFSILPAVEFLRLF